MRRGFREHDWVDARWHRCMGASAVAEHMMVISARKMWLRIPSNHLTLYPKKEHVVAVFRSVV